MTQDENEAEKRQKKEEEAEKRTAPPASVVYEAIRAEGEEELKRPSTALVWSGTAAGLSMGFSLVAEALLETALPEASWHSLISKFGYSVGFLIVILGRQQLFTENTLTPILPMLSSRKPLGMLPRVLRLWAIVLAANTVGACLFASVLANTDVLDASTRQTIEHLAQSAIEGSLWTRLLRAVFAGWLIALLVWILPFAETARVTAIIVITYFIGLGGFDHVVAGSTKAFFGVATGSVAVTTFFTHFWSPTLVGNIIGGVLFVAAINHAQVTAGK